jgi:hypothetical protein
LKKFLSVVLLASSWGAVALAADQPLYGPPPAWVKPIPLPKPAANASTATQVLLWNLQTRYGADGEEIYGEVATRIETSEGLADSGTLIQNWSPDTDTVTIHRMQVLRDGKAIDLLAGGKKLTVVRRETNLESAALDGKLTATLQVEDLRVGDVVAVAATLVRKDPALAGRSEAGVSANLGQPARRVYIRQLWPETERIRWKASRDLGAPALNASSGTELVYDFADRVPPDPPKGAPARYHDLSLLQVSEFGDWGEVAGVIAPLYATASQIGPDSPLRAEIERIKRAHPAPEGRAMAALRLVQDQVRYLYVGMDFGNYTPANADQTWTRRFGDCKGKTALLLALLRELGIKAEPALVSTGGGDGLEQRLPMLSWFDHVLVRAELGGKTYWLDGTRLGDRKLADVPVPDYRWALPVRPSAAKLEALEPTIPDEPEDERRLDVDLTGGFDKPAPTRAEQIYRGDDAVAFNLSMNRMSKVDADKAMRGFWLDRYPWLTPETVSFTSTRATGWRGCGWSVVPRWSGPSPPAIETCWWPTATSDGTTPTRVSPAPTRTRLTPSATRSLSGPRRRSDCLIAAPTRCS